MLVEKCSFVGASMIEVLTVVGVESCSLTSIGTGHRVVYVCIVYTGPVEMDSLIDHNR